jgi:hypothetical protein
MRPPLVAFAKKESLEPALVSVLPPIVIDPRYSPPT